MAATAPEMSKNTRDMWIPPSAFLLTWNPARTSDEGMAEAIVSTASGVPWTESWSTGGRRQGIEPGDRVYLLRQGTAGRGIVGSGIAISHIESDQHWADSSKTANYVDVEWDRIVATEDRLDIEDLKAAFPGQNWRPQSSGTQVRPEVSAGVDRLWSEHIAQTLPPAAPGGGQGHQTLTAIRIKIEMAAQNRLMAHFESEGWTVEDTHLTHPYDAKAIRGREVCYLEAKGTQSNGATVIVTKGEVDHARNNPGRCVIGIWSGITFDGDDVDELSGDFRVMPFEPRYEELTAKTFDWTTP